MAYDWILSLSDEVKYIWRCVPTFITRGKLEFMPVYSAAWSAPKVLYYISRYYPVCYLS